MGFISSIFLPASSLTICMLTFLLSLPYVLFLSPSSHSSFSFLLFSSSLSLFFFFFSIENLNGAEANDLIGPQSTDAFAVYATEVRMTTFQSNTIDNIRYINHKTKII